MLMTGFWIVSLFIIKIFKFVHANIATLGTRGSTILVEGWTKLARFGCGVDRAKSGLDDGRMEKIIYPRSPRETMDGWIYLPRFVDKIRLHLAGKLHPDYEKNFTNGFDAAWLKAAGVSAEQFIDVVKNSITDGEVCDWVRQNVKKTDAKKAELRNFILNRGHDDEATAARLKLRKEQAGISHRDDVQTFVDLIEVDEKRM
jgi:hypothetical protein